MPRRNPAPTTGFRASRSPFLPVSIPSPLPADPTGDVVKLGAKRGGRRRPSGSVESALRRERERVAQVLHDTICQELTGFYMLACGMALKYKPLSPEAAQKLLEMAAKIQRAGVNLGEYVAALRARKEP